MNAYALDLLLQYIDARIDEKMSQNDGTSRHVEAMNKRMIVEHELRVEIATNAQD